MRGLPGWYHKEGSGNLACTPNLACSEKCVAVLVREQTYSGDWKPCEA